MKKAIVLLLVMILSLQTWSQQILLQENFNPPSGCDSLIILGGWNITDSLFPGVFYAHSKVDNLQTYRMETEIMNVPALGGDYLTLEFDHICKVDFLDFARISLTFYTSPPLIDTLLISLPGPAYFGGGSYVLNGFRFTVGTYGTLWQPVNPSATPQPGWWRHEVFYLNYGNSLFSQYPFFKLQFHLKDGMSHGLTANYGWAVDNVKLSVGPFSAVNEPDNNHTDIYPNPVTDLLNLGTLFSSVRIFSSDGRLTGNFINCNQLDFSSYPPGIYLVIPDDHPCFRVVKGK